MRRKASEEKMTSITIPASLLAELKRLQANTLEVTGENVVLWHLIVVALDKSTGRRWLRARVKKAQGELRFMDGVDGSTPDPDGLLRTAWMALAASLETREAPPGGVMDLEAHAYIYLARRLGEPEV